MKTGNIQYIGIWDDMDNILLAFRMKIKNRLLAFGMKMGNLHWAFVVKMGNILGVF